MILKSDVIEARFSPLGARLTALTFDGVNVLAGGGSDAEILAGDWTAGAVCGRFAGRIAQARFALEGCEIRLARNWGPHQLHGGPENFALRRWVFEKKPGEIRFQLESPDGDQGFPGALRAAAHYRLAGNVLSLDLTAEAEALTVVNLTNHAYWNLGGGGNALAHGLQIEAGAVLETEGMIPTGRCVATPDFRTARPIRDHLDHHFALDGPRGALRRAATLSEPSSGRRMEIWTDEAGLQVYTASEWGRNNALPQGGGVALETQNFPDAPNHPHFPSSLLRPGETYRQSIEWRFFTGAA